MNLPIQVGLPTSLKRRLNAIQREARRSGWIINRIELDSIRRVIILVAHRGPLHQPDRVLTLHGPIDRCHLTREALVYSQEKRGSGRGNVWRSEVCTPTFLGRDTICVRDGLTGFSSYMLDNPNHHKQLEAQECGQIQDQS